MSRVGFIGLGSMGAGMAHNLVKTGHEVVVHDIREEPSQPLVAMGAMWADSVEGVARAADAVFTSLPGPQEMRAVGIGAGGLIETMRPSSVWVDLTTNSPSVVREVHEQCASKGIALLDAPVSGGSAGAWSGKLAIYVGGEREVFDRIRHLLDAIGDQVLYMGEIGVGNITKLTNNCAVFVIRMAIAEVFTLGVKAGVDPLELWHALRQGSIGRSRTFDRIDRYLRSDYEPPSFKVALAGKDFRLAMDLARELEVPMRCAEAAFEYYTDALDRGWGDRDSRSPMELQNQRAGVQIKVQPEDIDRTLQRG